MDWVSETYKTLTFGQETLYTVTKYSPRWQNCFELLLCVFHFIDSENPVQIDLSHKVTPPNNKIEEEISMFVYPWTDNMYWWYSGVIWRKNVFQTVY
jgi:hypothetical protein